MAKGAIDTKGRTSWVFWLGMVVSVAIMTCAAISPILPIRWLKECSMSVIWEGSALLATAIVFLGTWVDTFCIGKRVIFSQVYGNFNIVVAGLMILMIFFLFISFYFAVEGFGSSDPVWSWIVSRMGAFTLAMHSLIVLVAASCSLVITLRTSRAEFNPNYLELVDAANDETVVAKNRDWIKTFQEEKRSAGVAFKLVELPAVISFFAIFVSVLTSCILHQGDCVVHMGIFEKELKMFIGGAVAMALVVFNTVYIIERITGK